MKDKVNSFINLELLDLIKNSGSTDSLVGTKYSYSQIAKLIVQLYDENMIYQEPNTSQVKLTTDGLSLWEKYYGEKRLINLAKYLKPQEQFKMTPLKKYDIILPEDINF